MADYREFAPPAHLADAVECLWSLRQSDKSAYMHRVVPDGCADILFTRTSRKAALEAVGPMTKFEDFPVSPKSWTVGVRIRPGMWADQLCIPAARITDSLLLLEDLWGARARNLLSLLGD